MVKLTLNDCEQHGSKLSNEEKRALKIFATEHLITEEEQKAAIVSCGWTKNDFEHSMKEQTETHLHTRSALEKLMQRTAHVPNMHAKTEAVAIGKPLVPAPVIHAPTPPTAAAGIKIQKIDSKTTSSTTKLLNLLQRGGDLTQRKIRRENNNTLQSPSRRRRNTTVMSGSSVKGIDLAEYANGLALKKRENENRESNNNSGGGRHYHIYHPGGNGDLAKQVQDILKRNAHTVKIERKPQAERERNVKKSSSTADLMDLFEEPKK